MDLWTEALEEAYASAPNSEVVLHTLEFRHVSFPAPIRVVTDHGEVVVVDGEDVFGHNLTLEPSAAVDGGSEVFFQSCMFEVTLPDQREASLPSLTIELDNVTRLMSQYLDAALGERAPVSCTYREWLASDTSAPQFILEGLTIKEVVSDVFKVKATAQFSDLVNKTFPSKVYRPSEFRGLRQ